MKGNNDRYNASPIKRFFSNFLKGLLIIAPFALTFYILFFLVTTVDGLVGIDNIPVVRDIPGAGFLLVIILVTIIGFLASHYFTKKWFGYIERLIEHLPLVNLIYRSFRDIADAVMGKEKRLSHPVSVQLFEQEEIKVLGFLTRDHIKSWDGEELCSIYLPQSYNWAGNLVIVPRSRVKRLDVESTELFAFILSAGLAGDSMMVTDFRPEPLEPDDSGKSGPE